MTQPQHPWTPDPDRPVGTPPSGGIGTGSGGERGSSVFDGNAEFNADYTQKGTLPSRGPQRSTPIESGVGGSSPGYGRESAGAIEPLTNVTGTVTADSLTPASATPVVFTASFDSVSDFAITGTVSFQADGAQIGTGVLDASEDATYTHASGFPVGTYAITAVFPGNSRYSPFTTDAITVTVAA